MLPEEPGKHELPDAEVMLLPPAKHSHSRISRAFFRLLTAELNEDRVEIKSGYQMTADTWLVPDLSVRWPDQAVKNDYLRGSPMIAIEIVSPGNAAGEIDRKTASYLRNGAAEVWVVYPAARLMVDHTRETVEEITGEYRSRAIPVVVKLGDLLSKAN